MDPLNSQLLRKKKTPIIQTNCCHQRTNNDTAHSSTRVGNTFLYANPASDLTNHQSTGFQQGLTHRLFLIFGSPDIIRISYNDVITR